jgi:hypothetical protein
MTPTQVCHSTKTGKAFVPPRAAEGSDDGVGLPVAEFRGNLITFYARLLEKSEVRGLPSA